MKNLDNLRINVDKLDKEILSLIKKRFDLVRKIGNYKKENNIPIKSNSREEEILENILREAKLLNLSPIFVKNIWSLFFKESYKLEK